MAELLIATNGFKGTWESIEYGGWLAQTMRMKATLLGVTEDLSPAAIDDHHPLEDIFESAVSLFKDRGLEYSLEVQNGEAEQVIPEKANHGDFITVVGPLGRPPLKRWLTGRSIRPLMEKIKGPILYVPQKRLPVRRMLVSIGGLEYTEAAESLAFQIATSCHADVTSCMLSRRRISIIRARARCGSTRMIWSIQTPCPDAVCARRWTWRRGRV
jgi:hypothetical protein